MKRMINYMCLAITLTILILFVGCAKEGDFNPKLNNKQNALAYVDLKTESTPIINQAQQKQLYKAYLNHYYSPWSGANKLFSTEQIKEFTNEGLNHLIENPGWNENKHKHTKEWANQIIQNMAMNTYPNSLRKAITIREGNLRLFPTNKPSFSDITKPGSTYPFDNFQEAYVPANLPVLILQISKDKAWDLVLTNAAFGWVDANNVALVNKSFIKAWQNNQGYFEFKNDNTPIIDNMGVFRFMSHMGAIYPIEHSSKEKYIMNIAMTNGRGEAEIHKATIIKDKGYQIPMIVTPKNIATIANQFLGMPYGWGGLYGYRDCSATTMNIMSYFGIWLPRNSSKQAEVGGKELNLKNLSNKEKKNLIFKNAIPFMTLIHLPGHIMLYLGKHNNTLYALHDMWGLHTKHLFKNQGRAVVGKTVITPIDFGKQYINVEASLLDKVSTITILSER